MAGRGGGGGGGGVRWFWDHGRSQGTQATGGFRVSGFGFRVSGFGFRARV